MPEAPTDRRLEAFLDETLSVEEAAAIERQLRDDATLCARLAAVAGRRDRGDHSLGAVWQSLRLTCLDRSTLGSYVLELLDDDSRRAVELHVDIVGCHYCKANLDDLRRRRSPGTDATARRRRFFESSARRLPSARGAADAPQGDVR